MGDGDGDGGSIDIIVEGTREEENVLIDCIHMVHTILS